MTVLLGLLAAVTAGTSDFLGGLASREVKAIRFTFVAQALGAIFSAVIASFVVSSVVAADLWWGAVSGVAGVLGLLALYLGYAKARVGIAAPVAGVCTAALPAIVDAFTGGEALTNLALVGVLLGLVAVALVSMQGKDSDSATSGDGAPGSVGSSLLYGLAGGVGLGLLLVGLAQAGEDSGLWPLAMSRLAGAAMLAAVMVVTRDSFRLPRTVVPHVLTVAFIGAVANGAFLIATRVGSTAVAAVVTSLFPAFTVAWAVVVFKERLRPMQLAGLVLALVAIGLILVG